MSAFTTIAPQFEAFLARAKDDLALAPGRGGAPTNTRFIPRNFLLEECLDPSRIVSYAAALSPDGPTDFAAWDAAHKVYLGDHVFVTPPALHDYRVVAQDSPGVCPETFRSSVALSAFQETDLDTALIRLVPVADLAWLSRENEDRIFSLGEQVVADSSVDNPARQELSLILEEAYTSAQCDHRPVFTSFYEDFLGELSEPPDPSWPDRLRNRLGLYRLSQLDRYGLPCPVFLFKYQVRHVPQFRGKGDHRPIAIPTVLDHRFSEAFCSAPRELDRGRMLNLKAGANEEPAREVLHLFMPMQVEHLFRVGRVTTPVPDDLAPARRDHLLWLQVLADRNDYAIDTDADLLR
jgi:hypothetical protein